MGRLKAYNIDFKCKICKFHIELNGTKENINIIYNLLIQNHKSYSSDCKADKYEDFLAEQLNTNNEYDNEAKKLIEYSYKTTEEIMNREKSQLSDIIGNVEAKRLFKERLVDHVKYKERLERLKFYDECGIILAGIQGTGKTNLARVVVKDTILNNPEYLKKFDVLIMRASDFVLGNIGSTSKMISALLDAIRKSNKENNKETILIIDEIDSLLPKRKTDRISSKEKMSAMLDEFGGIHDDHTILLIGMTNLPDDIDDHALVTGRFGSPILINIPTPEERYEIFTRFSMGENKEPGDNVEKKIVYDKDIDSKYINIILGKFSGRDVRDFVKDLHKLNMKKHENGEHNSPVIITCKDIEDLFERKYVMIKDGNLRMLNELAKYYNKYGIDVEGSNVSENKEVAVNNFKDMCLDISNTELNLYELTSDVYSRYNEWKGIDYFPMKKGMFTKLLLMDKRIGFGNPKGKDGKQHDAYYNVRLKDNQNVSKNVIP